jgi:hypothetical protein
MHKLAILLAVPALALGACGGSSDEDDIKDIIQGVAKDSSTICDHATDNFLKDLSESGDVDGCKETARAYPDDSAETVGDIDVKVDGDSATADFTDNNDSKQHVTFVKDGDDWKIDKVE